MLSLLVRVAAYTPRADVSLPADKGRRVSNDDIYVLDVDEVSSLRRDSDQPQQPAAFAFSQGL